MESNPLVLIYIELVSSKCLLHILYKSMLRNLRLYRESPQKRFLRSPSLLENVIPAFSLSKVVTLLCVLLLIHEREICMNPDSSGLLYYNLYCNNNLHNM